MANDSRNLSLGEARLNKPPHPSDLSQPSLKTQGVLSLETQSMLGFETEGMLSLETRSMLSLETRGMQSLDIEAY